MPEAPVDKDRKLGSREHDVSRAPQTGYRATLHEVPQVVEMPPPEPPERRAELLDGWGDLDEAAIAPSDITQEAPRPDVVEIKPLANDDGWGDVAVTRLPPRLEVDVSRQATDHQTADGWLASSEVADVEEPELLNGDVSGADTSKTPEQSKEFELAKARRDVEEVYALQANQRDELSIPIEQGGNASQENSDLADQPIADLHEVAGGDHVNGAYRVELVDGQRGFLKPEAEENANIAEYEMLRADVPKGTEWRREVAAFELDRAAGLGLVPETVVRHEPELGFDNASLQAEVPRGPMPVRAYSEEDADGMAALDYVLGNTDRHNQNYMTQADGRPAAIDNGLTFPESDTDGIRSQWVAERLGRELDPAVVDKFRAVDDRALADYWSGLGIGERAIDGARARLHEVQTGKITGMAWRGEIYDGSTSTWNLIRPRI